jgi:hypothetical protein
VRKLLPQPLRIVAAGTALLLLDVAVCFPKGAGGWGGADAAVVAMQVIVVLQCSGMLAVLGRGSHPSTSAQSEPLVSLKSAK